MKKVLIIGDDQITQSLHTQALEDQGYAVITSDNGPDGVMKAIRERPNMVFLDLGLPSPSPAREFDGLAALQWLRRSESTRGIPIAVVTIQSKQQVKELTRDCGAEAFIQKPAKPDQFKATARILLDDL